MITAVLLLHDLQKSPANLDLSGPLHMEVKPARRVRVIEEHTMIAPNLQSITWGIGFGTCPSDDGQTLEDLELQALDSRFTIKKVTDKLGQEFWVIYAPATSQTSQRITVRFKATLVLNSRVLTEGKSTQDITLPNRDYWTRNFETSDSQPASYYVKSRSLERIEGERDVVYAKRVLDSIQNDFHYKYIAGGERGVAGCVKNGFGACGELNTLAVNILRLAKIPARTRPGRNAAEANLELSPESVWSYHVAAEFWGDGIGWIPIEASANSGQETPLGFPLTPFLGTAAPDHVNKHYNFVHLDAQQRSFQNLDWVFGSWRGTWDGWHMESKYGYSSSPVAN